MLFVSLLKSTFARELIVHEHKIAKRIIDFKSVRFTWKNECCYDTRFFINKTQFL